MKFIQNIVKNSVHHPLLTACVFLSCSILSVKADEPLPPPEKFDLFILAGQSNMAGRGALDDASAKAPPRVLKWTSANHWAPATEPLHWDKGVAGAGLGRSFAEAVTEKYPDLTVGLIPTACGGSPISAWAPGEFHGQTGSHPYDDCIARAKSAAQNGKIKAILWHQGESDNNPAAAAVYEEKLRELIARFRADLGIPDLPFLIGQLGQFPDQPWSESMVVIDQAQQNIARTTPGVYFVSSEGLLSKGDNVHFNTESLREFGKRYAQSYFKAHP